MPIGYKLTDANGETHGHMVWGEGVTHEALPEPPNSVFSKDRLCTRYALHLYDSPALAVVCNMLHANFHGPRLWECEYTEPSVTDGLKRGTKTLRTIKELSLPIITVEQLQSFAFAVADYSIRVLAEVKTGKITSLSTAKAAYTAATAAIAAHAASLTAYAAGAAASAAYAASAADAATYAAAYAAYATTVKNAGTAFIFWIAEMELSQ